VKNKVSGLKGKTFSFDVCEDCKLICCQDANPPLTASRIKIVREFFKTNNFPLGDVFIAEEYIHPSADSGGFCFFYSKEDKKCRIHHVKPETCKAGPFTFDINPLTRKVEWFLKKGCLCALAEKLFGDKIAFRDHFNEAKVELMKLICDLDSSELKAILKIDEPQTFKVGETDLPAKVIEKLGL
jgi:Fe-S-cluster containining protein